MPKTIFPNLPFILAKIHKFCVERHIVLFDAPKVAHPIAKAKETQLIQKKEPVVAVKKCTKRKINFVSTAKWETDELSFPPLHCSQASHDNISDNGQADKNVTEKSLKSTLDTNENKSVIPTTENRSITFVGDQKNSEIMENKSQTIPNDYIQSIPCVEEKDLLSKSNLTSVIERKNSGSFENLKVEDIKSHFENHKDRNSKSAHKGKGKQINKTKSKNESQKRPKHSDHQHDSSPKKKANECTESLHLNKTSIEMNKSAKSESGRKTTDHTENDELSTFASDAVLDYPIKVGKAEHYIEENLDGLTNLDLMILTSMNKCYPTFERSTSRYNFVKDSENSDIDKKMHQCQKFTSLIQSFLDDENPLSKSSDSTTKKAEEGPTKEFRLFDQSYTLQIGKKSS